VISELIQWVKLIDPLFFYWLSLLLYIVIQTIETISLGARVAGKACELPALGVTLYQTFSTLSRIFLPIFLILLAFLVERGMYTYEFLTFALIGSGVSFCISVFVFVKIGTIYRYFFNVTVLLEKCTMPIAIILALVTRYESEANRNTLEEYSNKSAKKKPLVVLTSLLSYFLLSSGILIAFLFAIHYPEYRLTAVQFSAIFHGVGVILISFYINPVYSQIMDLLPSDLLAYSNSVLIGRLFGLFLTFLLFLIIYFLNA